MFGRITDALLRGETWTRRGALSRLGLAYQRLYSDWSTTRGGVDYVGQNEVRLSSMKTNAERHATLADLRTTMHPAAIAAASLPAAITKKRSRE